jgi:hypothetical protein
MYATAKNDWLRNWRTAMIEMIREKLMLLRQKLTDYCYLSPEQKVLGDEIKEEVEAIEEAIDNAL